MPDPSLIPLRRRARTGKVRECVDFTNNTHTNMNNIPSTTMKTTIDNQQETVEIEFSRELYDRVKRASAQEGISIDQWMLEAVLFTFEKYGLARAQEA